ncbi:GNAT family N-acetyltransferase, partial [Bacillus cereus]
NFIFYPALTGSKTPTSKFAWSKEVRSEINCP